jgi:hypothetical protein
MTNKIVSIRTIDGMTCLWRPTGDPRAPLACIWVDGITPRGLKSASSSDDVEEGLRQCA